MNKEILFIKIIFMIQRSRLFNNFRDFDDVLSLEASVIQMILIQMTSFIQQVFLRISVYQRKYSPDHNRRGNNCGGGRQKILNNTWEGGQT